MTSDLSLRVEANSVQDIHKAYLSGVNLVANGYDDVTIKLDHNEEANVVRGYSSGSIHGTQESVRLSGGGSYFHLADQNGDVATTCINRFIGHNNPRDGDDIREHFGKETVKRLTQGDLDLTDLVYDFDRSPDIKTTSGRQVVGASVRYFGFSEEARQKSGKRGAFVYRACVQDRDVIDDAVRESAQLLERDGFEPDSLLSATKPVGNVFNIPGETVGIDELVEKYDDNDNRAHHDTVSNGLTTFTPAGRKPWYLSGDPTRFLKSRKHGREYTQSEDSYVTACLPMQPSRPARPEKNV